MEYEVTVDELKRKKKEKEEVYKVVYAMSNLVPRILPGFPIPIKYVVICGVVR